MRSPCSLASSIVVFASPLLLPMLQEYRLFSTQNGLYANAKEKRSAVSSKKGQAEHGSVLNELMSVKQEEQPKQLTVGAKGV